MNQDGLRIRWLIRLRWAAIVGQAAMISTFLFVLRIRIPFLLLALVLLAAAISQGVLWYASRLRTQPGTAVMGGVLALDVLLLTAMLFLTGGPHNPFTVLYLTQVAMAASLLGVRWTWGLLGLVLACFGGLFWRYVPLPIPTSGEAICGVAPARLHLVGMFVALALTGGCLAWFVARLNAQLWERKQLERTVEQITQREQQDLGTSLHEDLCQRLAGLTALGKSLEKRLHGTNETGAEIASEITRELKQTLTLASQMAERLLPVAALQDGFLAAVNELATATEQEFGLRCQVVDSDFPTLIDPYTANHLYRMVEEATANVVRHAEATTIEIKLSSTDRAINVAVADDGIGIPETPEHQAGVGLQIMRYRSDLIHATLSISRLSPHGTAVAIQFPRT